MYKRCQLRGHWWWVDWKHRRRQVTVHTLHLRYKGNVCRADTLLHKQRVQKAVQNMWHKGSASIMLYWEKQAHAKPLGFFVYLVLNRNREGLFLLSFPICVQCKDIYRLAFLTAGSSVLRGPFFCDAEGLPSLFRLEGCNFELKTRGEKYRPSEQQIRL